MPAESGYAMRIIFAPLIGLLLVGCAQRVESPTVDHSTAPDQLAPIAAPKQTSNRSAGLATSKIWPETEEIAQLQAVFFACAQANAARLVSSAESADVAA